MKATAIMKKLVAKKSTVKKKIKEMESRLKLARADKRQSEEEG